MNPAAPDRSSMRSPDDGAATPGLPPDIAARRLVAVPWRHPALIVSCALAGALASALAWPQATPVRHGNARPHVQPIEDAPPPSPTGIALRLDLDPGRPVGATGAPAAAPAPAALALLRMDAAEPSDGIDAALRDAPPAAGWLASTRADRLDVAGSRVTLPGLAAGLLLGLLLAAWRELGGERMRSAREAEWALGAPVLGAIPTLSAKARRGLLEPPPAGPDAA